jgi:hypothetical protein
MKAKVEYANAEYIYTTLVALDGDQRSRMSENRGWIDTTVGYRRFLS